MLTALVFWFIFALAVGFIADARGRSGFGWFFLAILISPLIACVLILALPTPRSKSALSGVGVYAHFVLNPFGWKPSFARIVARR